MVRKIFVINLDRCKEKKQKMEERLKGEDYEIFKAYDGLELSTEKLEEINAGILKEWKDPYSGRNVTWGEVGCSLSHYCIYEKCVEENIETAIILEDDVIIPKNFSEHIDDCLESLNLIDDWEFCYLGRKLMDSNNKSLDLTEKIIKAGYSYWTCAYIVNLKGMKKIIDSEMKKNIITPDEVLPIIAQVSPYKNYYKYYNLKEPLKMYSLKTLSCRPEPEAFKKSDTENSQEIEYYDDNLLILATGTDMTDGLKRFIKSCKTYGLKYKIMGLNTQWNGGNMKNGPGGGQKINLLYETLKELKEEQIILITDSYDVIMSSNSKEIIEKYKKFNKDIVFASESCCWPNKNIAQNYPQIIGKKNIYLNSGGFIGKVKTIRTIISTVKNNCDDQEWYTRIFLSEEGRKIITLDYNCEIFQCLNDAEEELKIDFTKSRICNKNNNTYPCQIHGNGGTTRKLLLNKYENYLMKNWTDTYGYNTKNIKDLQNIISLKIYILFYWEKDEEQYIDDFDIDNSKSFIQKNIEELKTIIPNIELQYSNLKLNDGLKEALNLNVDYCWIINPNFIITNKITLTKLLNHNKGIIIPLLSKPGLLWSNFWGDIDKNGWYQKSFDYIDIVNRKIKGCWNVPHIAGNILIEKEYIAKVQDFFTNKSGNSFFDLAMIFSHNCRNNNISTYVINQEEYGYIIEKQLDKIPKDVINKSLFSFNSNTSLWEKRYLHPEFLKYINKSTGINIDKPCEWVFKFPFVNERFCDELLSEVNQRCDWSIGTTKEKTVKDERINSIENYPTQDIHMKQIGFREIWEQIVHKYIAPLVSKLYAPFQTKGINIAFVVKYELEKQKELAPHHDSSAYSINIALNKQDIDFEGGGTRFIRQNTTVQNEKGWAIIHPGRLTHYHEGLPITSGKRYIFVSFVN